MTGAPLPLARQIVFHGRVRRALHACAHGRISGETFDSILARIRRQMGLP